LIGSIMVPGFVITWRKKEESNVRTQLSNIGNAVTIRPWLLRREQSD